MIGRIAWIALLAVIGGGAFLLQLDRSSRFAGEYAAFVPGPFRGFAQQHVVSDLIAAGAADRALGEAQILVDRRPYEARHLQLLAKAQLDSGQPARSASSIQQSAQRGWREDEIQAIMVRLAIARQDGAAAARHFAALLADSNRENAQLRELGRVIFPGSQGATARATMAEMLAVPARWSRIFVSRGADVMPPETFSEIIALAAAQGGEFDCDRLQQAQRRLKDSEAAQTLIAVRKQQCG